jgi:hypothetical protein
MDITFIVCTGLILLLGTVVVIQGFQLRSPKADPKKDVNQLKPVGVTEPTAAELEAQLRAAYQAEITKATATFGEDLKGTSTKLSEQVSRLTTQVIEQELEAYQKTLEEVREVATKAMEQIHDAVEHQRIELRQGMEAELATEKQHLADKFDAKMGDVIASYISESLGSGVDLGAQMQFILTSLEAHKAEIRKDLLDGV